MEVSVSSFLVVLCATTLLVLISAIQTAYWTIKIPRVISQLEQREPHRQQAPQ